MSDAILLEEAKQALHKLITGTQVVDVEVDGHRVRYTQSSRTSLTAYVRDLEAKLDASGTVPKLRRRPIRFRG